MFNTESICNTLLEGKISCEHSSVLFDIISHKVSSDDVVKKTIAKLLVCGTQLLQKKSIELIFKNNLMEDSIVEKQIIKYYFHYDKYMLKALMGAEGLEKLYESYFINERYDTNRGISQWALSYANDNILKESIRSKIFDICRNTGDDSDILEMLQSYISQNVHDCSGVWTRLSFDLISHNSDRVKFRALKLIGKQFVNYDNQIARSWILNNIGMFVKHYRQFFYHDSVCDNTYFINAFSLYLDKYKIEKYKSSDVPLYIDDMMCDYDLQDNDNIRKLFYWFAENGSEYNRCSLIRIWSSHNSISGKDVRVQRIMLENLIHREELLSNTVIHLSERVYNIKHTEFILEWTKLNIGKIRDASSDIAIQCLGDDAMNCIQSIFMRSNPKPDDGGNFPKLKNIESYFFMKFDYENGDGGVKKKIFENIYRLENMEAVLYLMEKFQPLLRNNAKLRNWAIDNLERNWAVMCNDHDPIHRDIMQSFMKGVVPVLKKYKNLRGRVKKLLFGSHKHSLTLWRDVRTQYKYFFDNIDEFVDEATKISQSNYMTFQVEGFTVLLGQTRLSWGCNGFRWNNLPTFENSLHKGALESQNTKSIEFGWDVINSYKKRILPRDTKDPDDMLYRVYGPN